MSDVYRGPLVVTANLASSLAVGADGPPQLDALLEWSLSPFSPSFQRNRGMWRAGQFRDMDPQYQFKLTRSGPAPKQGEIRIPLERVQVGEWLVAKCSDPILPASQVETVEHITKRIATEAAGLLRPSERRIVSTTNSWTKSYRLPLRVLAVPCVRWLCVGNRREILKALRDVKALGKKVADGYGRVSGWTAEHYADDHTWLAPHPSGATVLMRRLPRLVEGLEWLPALLVGARRDFGACCAPYWHPERRTEIMVPL